MSFDLDELYGLLPAVYRVRDVEEDAAATPGGPADEILEPLRAFLSVLAQQALVLEENVDQLYDDQFIETCAEWVVPYLGDLVGTRSLHTAPGSGLSQRADVANTIGYRRRKGTVNVVEQLARDVTDWDAHVVEFFQRLVTTQYMNHLQSWNLATPDLRDWKPLEYLPTSFDSTNHTFEVRRISSGRGKYAIPNIGIFLWRLGDYGLDQVPAARVDAARYRFNPLGIDTPLVTRPLPEGEFTQLSGPMNVPQPITRRVLDSALAAYIGDNLSLNVIVDGANVPLDQIVACDLSDSGGDWAHLPRTTYGVDPVLGRLALPEAVAAGAPDVLVSYHYGFAADIGGGEYDRASSIDMSLEPLVSVPADETLENALAAPGRVVEVSDSDIHTLPAGTTITLAANTQLELRAVNDRRPIVALGGDLECDGGEESELTLNGLVIVGGALRVGGQLQSLTLRHCTLVPGLGFAADGSPADPGAPSLVITSPGTHVVVEQSILGGIRAAAGVRVELVDSFADAGDPTGVAYAALDGVGPGGALQASTTTIVGCVNSESIPLATNAILLAEAGAPPWDVPVNVERRQEGCVRFSWLPVESKVPRRYRCRPATGDDPLRIRPSFTSLRYGDPGYGQLDGRSPVEIRTGADDGSEMGGFHLVYQPQREANLRIRLDEYLRFGLEAGIFYVT